MLVDVSREGKAVLRVVWGAVIFLVREFVFFDVIMCWNGCCPSYLNYIREAANKQSHSNSVLMPPIRFARHPVCVSIQSFAVTRLASEDRSDARRARVGTAPPVIAILWLSSPCLSKLLCKVSHVRHDLFSALGRNRCEGQARCGPDHRGTQHVRKRLGAPSL